MDISRTQEGKASVLSLSGNLDTVTSPQLYEALLPLFNEAEHVVLDFSGVEYVSSAGLRVLLQGEKTAKSEDKSMALRCVSAEVMEVFDMTGFSEVLTIEA